MRSIESHCITVGDIAVEVVRKHIKNLHLRVYPPHGRVRIAAPLRMSNEAVRLFVIEKLAWIKRQQAKFAELPSELPREMVNGESHYFLGRQLRLRVHEHNGRATVALRGITSVDLFVRNGTTRKQREAALLRWYREQLSTLVPPLLNKWQTRLRVQVAVWRIKIMRTRWGSCNPRSRRVSLNLELAKKPPQCLEYVVVHELVHMLERSHNDRFKALMDAYLPEWRDYRKLLNGTALVQES